MRWTVALAAVLGGFGASVACSQPSASPLQPVAGIFPGFRDARPLSAAEEAAVAPFDHFKECDACPEMVIVPRGHFIMGSSPDEEGRSLDEQPQRRVDFTHPFAVGR